MSGGGKVTVLKGAHVIDPGQNIDRVMDVAIADGKIKAVGPSLSGDETIDVSGSYLSPGWIDLHVHAYGVLGFAEPDSIGVYQGVTTYVDAGGAGIDTLDELAAMMDGRSLTRLYAGVYMRPTGIISLNFIDGDTRSLIDIPIAKWLDALQADRDRVRYLKVAALSGFDRGPMKLFKGLSETLNLPLYAHVGEFQLQPGKDSTYEIYDICEKGDIVTHVYHGNECGLIGADGKIMPVIRDAAKRGVLFDVGFGGYNFSWEVAEKGVAQGFLPHTLSSDLQQFNVVGPCFSLANVMSVFLHLGLSVQDVVERVTINPARALHLEDRAGWMKPGMPADITVFKVEDGEFELRDTQNNTRTGKRRFMPTIAFKDGQRVDCDVTRCQDERNWLVQISEDALPAAASRLTGQQKEFLGNLAANLSRIQWDGSPEAPFDVEKCMELRTTLDRARDETGLALKPALMALYDSFLDHPFTMPAGIFLIRRERDFALTRLREASQREKQLA